MAIKIQGTTVINDSRVAEFAELIVSGTGATKISTGTTGQRPGSPVSGQLRFNSDTGNFEGYNGTVWDSVGVSLQEKQYTKVGTLSVTSGTAYWLIPTNIKIVGVLGNLGTAPTGSSLVAVVKKNGATLLTLTFGVDVDQVEITGQEYNLTKGDNLSVDITQVGGATPGSDLTIVFLFKRS